MKVIARFAFAFFVASCLCLAAVAYANVRREARELREGAVADLTAFGEGLGEGVAGVWARHDERQAIELVGAAAGKRDGVDLAWTAGPSAAAAAPADGSAIVVGVPVRVNGEVVGTLVLRRAVAGEGSLFREALHDEVAFAALLAVSLGALAVVLGGAFIGRPLQRAVMQAERIGAGDLTQRLASRRTDEIGALERSMNAMCDRLGESREKLERESTARIEALEQLRHLDRLRTVGTMASSMAHELGTPLNVVLLRAQTLAAGEAAREEVTDAGRTILAQVEKMSRLVRQILGFSRRAPSRGDVALGTVAHEAADLLEALTRKSKARLSVVVEEDAVVQGDAVELQQAVTNLVVNGLHAMPKGGALRLRVGVREDAKSSPSASPVRAGFIEVADEGTGIDSERLERIFEPFYTTRPSGEGTGLGLSVARGIAEDHGGWIAAKSEPGRGSVFTLFVPAPG